MPFAYVTMALSQPVNIRTERSSLFAFFEVSHLHNYCEPTRRQCSDPTLPAATIRSSNISSSRFKASLKFVGPLKSKNAVKTIYFSYHALGKDRRQGVVLTQAVGKIIELRLHTVLLRKRKDRVRRSVTGLGPLYPIRALFDRERPSRFAKGLILHTTPEFMTGIHDDEVVVSSLV